MHCVDGSMILKCVLKKRQEGVGENHLTEDGDQWWNIVNILMKKLKVFFKCKEILYMLGNC